MQIEVEIRIKVNDGHGRLVDEVATVQREYLDARGPEWWAERAIGIASGRLVPVVVAAAGREPV